MTTFSSSQTFIREYPANDERWGLGAATPF